MNGHFAAIKMSITTCKLDWEKKMADDVENDIYENYEAKVKKTQHASCCHKYLLLVLPYCALCSLQF